jgi:protein-S-isoprenylcysteine O-methyltransferase Ste14
MYIINGYSIVFIVTALFWIIPELWLLFRDRKVKPEVGRNNGRYLYFLLMYSIIACVLLSINLVNIPITQNSRFLTGSLIIWGGLFFRWWAIYSLGKYFNIVVTVQSGQKIIKNGPYKYIRHPSYTGSMLILFGFGFSLGNWIGLAIILIISLISFYLRAIVEEKVMVSSFGNDYLNYMRQTTRFIPFIQ